MDASSHKLHTLGTADNVDVPQSVRGNVANAESAAVVQRLLGLRMMDLALDQNQVIQRIEDRLFSVVNETRASISRDELRTALDTNLNNALQQIRPSLNFAAASQREKIQAIAQATYESVPSDVIYQLGITSAPVHIGVDGGQPTSIVEIPAVTINGTPSVVRIDTNHPFWRQNTFRNQSDMQQAMRGLTGREIGIINPDLRDHRLGTNEIARLTNAQFDIVSVPSVNVADSEALVLRVGTATTDSTMTVRINALLKGTTTDDAPVGLQNRNIAELNTTQIRELLLHRGTAGTFPYWRLYVSAGNNLPTDQVTQCITQPFLIGFNLAATAEAEMIRAGVPANARVGARSIRLMDAHTDVRAEQAKLQTLMEKLANGSENPGGAALALSLAASNRSVMASATQQAEETKLRTELTKDRAKLELVTQLKKLGELKANFRIPTMPSLGAANYELIFNERANLSHDIGIIGHPTATWRSDYCSSGGIGLPSAFTSQTDKRDLGARLQQQLKEVTEEGNRYVEVANALNRIALSANTAEVYTSSNTLSTRASNTGTVNRTAIGSDFNNVAVAEAIATETKLESVAEIEESIKKNEDLLKKSKAGGESGDALQQKIFEEHFKRQGLSVAEAKKSANYLYTRSLLDDELTSQHQALIDDLFESIDHGSEDRKVERKGRTSLRHVATALGIQTVNRNYDWDRASYRTLVTAYFSLKKIYEGGTADSVNAPGSHAVQGEMKRIAEVLSRRHTTMLLNDMGNDLPDEDRKKLGSRKALSAETLEQFLTGEAPEKYVPRIDAVLHATEGRIYRAGRNGRRMEAAGALAASSFIIGAKGIGKGANATLSGANAAKNWTWAQRGNIATFSLFTALGGPLGMGAWGIMKGMSGSSPAAAHAHAV